MIMIQIEGLYFTENAYGCEEEEPGAVVVEVVGAMAFRSGRPTGGGISDEGTVACCIVLLL